MDSERIKTARNRCLSLILKLSLIIGWVFYRDTSYFPNLVTVTHAVLWCLVPVFVLGFGGLVAASRHMDKLSNQPKAVSNSREMYRAINSWGWRWWMQTIEAPFLLFIGIALGDWSLLFVQTIVLMFSVIVMASGAELYRRLPPNLKGGDQNGNGVPDDEELLKKNGVDPITKLKMHSEEKKAEAAQRREDILSSLVGGDL